VGTHPLPQAEVIRPPKGRSVLIRDLRAALPPPFRRTPGWHMLCHIIIVPRCHGQVRTEARPLPARLR